MNRQRWSGVWQRLVLGACFGLTLACTSSVAQHEGPAASPSHSGARAAVIDHLVPARDSIGRAPATFSWTPVEGADDYSIGIWNEVDVMVWRQNHVPTTSVARPDDLRLEPGTYFWSVSALRGGQEIAESGLAAFVVRE